MPRLIDRSELAPAAPLAVGQVLEIQRSFSQADFDRFARLSGDDNPIHVDPAFASRTRFGRIVAHGMLLYSAVEAALSRLAPALASISQTLKFPNPTYAGEPVCIRLEVTALDSASGLATIATSVIRPDGAAGLEGEAVLGLPERLSSVGYGGAGQAAPNGSDAPWAELQRSFSLAELAEYASLASGLSTGEVAMGLPTIAGGLLGSLFSCLLGTQLPGKGTNYLKQRLEFHLPAHPMQALVARVQVIRVRPDKHLVNLSTLCTTVAGEVICNGEALVLVSDLASVVMSNAAGGSRAHSILMEENRP